MENDTPQLINQPQSTDQIQPIIQSKKGKANIPAIVLGITTIICASLATFFGISYFSPEKETKDNNEVVTTNDSPETTNEAIAASTMAEDYQEVKDLITNLTSDIETNFNYTENGSGLTYKPEGLNTYIPMKYNIQKKISNSGTNETNMATLQSKLENAGFNSIGTIPHLGSAGPAIYGYILDSQNIACGLYGDKDFHNINDPNDGYEYVLLYCGKTDWTWLTEPDMKLASELEKAYYDKTGQYPVLLDNLDNEIKDSEYAPYQTLQVSVGGAAGLFYRTSPESEWQYFTAAQAVLPCTDYNTNDLKKAYAGEICYEDQTESTVQP